MNAYEFIVKMRDHASSGLRKVARSTGMVDNQMKRANRTTSIWESSLGRFKSMLIGAFSIVAITLFTHKVINARAEYEKFQAVLTNTFQSADVGDAALNMLTQFAAKTPFALNELTGSFVKLVNRGINPTKTELTKMGDLAASQGKGFDQLTEAILDAGTNEFERLKEFGIKASKNGNKVTLMFKNQKKVVDANSKSIKNAILEYGAMKGVAGSMEAISKTLGGKLNNLGDQWNNFLIAVGGQSSGVFSSFVDMASTGLSILTHYLPQISMWFRVLWDTIKPVGVALWNLIDAAFGFSNTSSVMQTFGNIMSGVLLVVGWFTSGLTTLINWLYPFADAIGMVALIWAGFNALLAVTPLGWIIIGIVTLISLIGMISKYTSGWGDAWQHTVNGAKYLWQTFTDSAESVWTKLVNNFMIGINKIKAGWYEFKNAVNLGDSAENDAALRKIQLDTERRKQEIAEAKKAAYNSFEKAKDEFNQVKINVDTEGIKNDFQKLKDKFKGIGEKSKGTEAYDNYLKKLKEDKNNTKGTKPGSSGTAPGTSIVGGGAKKTNINITIEKLQDDTKIYVSNTEEGINDLGEKVQEILLRAVNSVNNLQTS